MSELRSCSSWGVNGITSGGWQLRGRPPLVIETRFRPQSFPAACEYAREVHSVPVNAICAARGHLQAIPALPQLAPILADAAVFRHSNNLEEFRACNFQAAPRSHIVRVAGDPHGIDAEAARKRQQQHQRSRCIVMTAVRLVDAVADMSCIALDVRR